MLPEDYRQKIEESLESLWSTWRSLGLYSEGPVAAMPFEEAIIGVCILGRYDQRLFDEAVSTMILHSRLMSKNRLLYHARKLDDDSRRVFQVIAAILKEKGGDSRFVSIFADEKKKGKQAFFLNLDRQAAFSGKSEDPLFNRFGFERNNFVMSDKIRNLKYIASQNPYIRAKLIYGNTVRAETVMEIMNRDDCTAPSIAIKTGYTQKSVWNILNDFELAGLVKGEKSFNRIVYHLTVSGKKMFSHFSLKKAVPGVTDWIKMGHLLFAFEKLPDNASELLIQSEEKRVDRILRDLKL